MRPTNYHQGVCWNFMFIYSISIPTWMRARRTTARQLSLSSSLISVCCWLQYASSGRSLTGSLTEWDCCGDDCGLSARALRESFNDACGCSPVLDLVHVASSAVGRLYLRTRRIHRTYDLLTFRWLKSLIYFPCRRRNHSLGLRIGGTDHLPMAVLVLNQEKWLR